ncbi:MAG: YIP1 family protein [Ardenticatenaceae bacterium]|nr:YIP1 family protein [Ardenticatenaceae bacterium]MCB8986419.1 YIP1 family protein [Ardenticatenaceae bacterium]
MMFWQRIKGVFSLDREVFRDIEQDESSLSQAAIIVLLVAILAGIGAAGAAAMGAAAVQSLSNFAGDLDLPSLTPSFGAAGAFINAFVGAFISWGVWALVTYFIGVKVFNGESTVSEMMRLIGFAQAPRLMSVFSFIPCIGFLFSFAGWIWAIVTSIIAIQEGVDLDAGKSFATILLSIVAVIIVNILIVGPILNLIF